MTPVSARKLSWIHILLFCLILLTILFISILASVPPVDRDALTHHLLVPKLFLEHGGIHEISHLVFSYYPMNLTMLYTIPLYFNNDILPKFIHFVFALATAAIIYRYLLRRLNITYALLGALFFLTIPVIVRLSSTVYVDLGLIFFFFASLLYLFHWIESDFKPRHLIISAIFCGLALGTKYNGLVGFFLLAMVVPFVYARYHAGQKLSQFKSIRWCLVFIIVALVVFSPWMARNVYLTGNPVYPLYNKLFTAQEISNHADEEIAPPANRSARTSHIHYRRIVHEESWAEIALIPLRVFFQGQDDNPKYFDGKTSPFLLILPIFAFFGLRGGTRQEKTEKMILLFFSVFFLLYACAQASIRIRYFSPILPPLVVLSMYGLYNLQTTVLERSRIFPSKLKNAGIAAIIVVMLGLNVTYMAERFAKDQPLGYIIGQVSRDDYIQYYRPEYASFQYANHHLMKTDKILGLYLGNRHYYSDIPIEGSTDLLKVAGGSPESGPEVAEGLHSRGFTHILVNFSILNRWVPEYSLHKQHVLKDFFANHAVLEFSKSGYGLLRLINVPGTDDNGFDHARR